MVELYRHDKARISLVIISITLYAIVIVLNQLSARGILFPTQVGNISRIYRNDITPAPFVFPIIWSTIFIWQAIWLIYAFVFIFRRHLNGDLLYQRVDILNYGFFVAFISNCIGMIVWLPVWTNGYITWAFIILAYLTISLYVALFILSKKLIKATEELANLELNVDTWLIRVLMQNGLAFFATWGTFATLLNFTSFLTYVIKIEMTLSGTISLSIISLILVTYSILENFILYKYLLYVITPWVVTMTALSGSLLKNWLYQHPTRNNIILFVMLMVSIILTLLKGAMFLVYHTLWSQKLGNEENNKDKSKDVMQPTTSEGYDNNQ